MNLIELRNKIKNITDYNPEVQSYLDDLDNLINDSYANIYTAKRWNFAQETNLMNIFPDILPSTLLTATVVDGIREVTFNVDIQDFKEDPREFEGQIFQFEDRDYTIDQVITDKIIRLREPFRGTTGVHSDKWKIIHRHYNLPPDLIEILNLAHSDTPVAGVANLHGKKAGLAKRRAEELNLEVDRTATNSEVYVMLTPVDIPAGKKFGPATITTVPLVPTGFLPNTSWEFAWAFLHDGIVGPLSQPQIVNIGAQEGGTFPVINLKLEQWDDQPTKSSVFSPLLDVYTTPLEGFKKVLVYNSNFDHNTGERRGLPLWRYVRASGLIKTRHDWQKFVIADDTDTAVIGHSSMVGPGNERYIEVDGQHQRVRPWPRPQGFDKEFAKDDPKDLYHRQFRQWVLRYLAKPKQLCADTDSPEMPYEFHQLIVYSVLFEVFTKANNSSMAMLYDKKIHDAIKVLERRYIDRTDVFWQRGQFGITHNGVYMDANSFRKLN